MSLAKCRQCCMLFRGHQQPQACSVVCCSMVQTGLEAVPCCMSRQAGQGSLGSPLHIARGLAAALPV